MPIVCQQYSRDWDTSVNKTYKNLSPHEIYVQGGSVSSHQASSIKWERSYLGGLFLETRAVWEG